jgi:uncharacterized membrane protein
MMIILWVLIGVGIYYVLKSNGKIDFDKNSQSDPESVLKQRYVNGEIDDETYSKMLKTLRK